MMEREKHEELLNEILVGEVERSRLTEILQELRADNTQVLEETQSLMKKADKLERDNDDLIISNSKLFRQVGIVGTEKEEEVGQKELSETITIESIEGGNK